MTDATHLFLLRHAEVESRYHRIFGGKIDMELSPRGHEQAALLADYLRPKTFDAIYVSPMKRAQLTLAPLLAGRTCQPVTVPGLREVDFGAWTGLSWEQVKEKFNVSAFEWLTQLELGAIPDAEALASYRGRAEAALEQIVRAHPGQSVAIVCHGGIIRMLLSILLDLPLRKTAMFEVEYASITHVSHCPPKTEVRLLNFAPWRGVA